MRPTADLVKDSGSLFGTTLGIVGGADALLAREIRKVLVPEDGLEDGGSDCDLEKDERRSRDGEERDARLACSRFSE